MNPVTILRPDEDLIGLIASRLKPAGNDYSRSLVVFPGKRPAHFLRQALAEKSRTPILPPVIHSSDSFVGFLFSEKLGLQPRLLPELDAVALLYEIHRSASGKIGGERYLSLDGFLPIGLKLFAELEEVAMANLPLEAVKNALQQIQFRKFHFLGDYYERFYAELGRLGVATRSSMARAVAAATGEIDLDDFESVHIAGFYAFTAAERKIVSGLAARPNVWMLFQAGKGLEKQLEKLKIDANIPEVPQVDPDRVTFTKAPDTHGQMLALAAALNAQIAGEKALDQRTAIVLPTAESLFPLIRFPLSLVRSGAYNIAMGYPLERTPVFGFLNTMLEVVSSVQKDEVSVESYLGLLLHPYTKNIRFGTRADITRVFFHTIEEFLAERQGRLRVSLRELENDQQLLQQAADRVAGLAEHISRDELQSHLKTIHAVLIHHPATAESIGQFARRMIEALTHIDRHSTANLHPLFGQFIESAIKVLDEISTSRLADGRVAQISAYASFLKQCLAGHTVPFPGTPLRGLQVLGLLETRNIRFDTLYILDVNDDILPGSSGADLLLPQKVREKLGLETARDREQLTEYYFSLAAASAGKVHLLYTESTSRWKSRFVERLLWQFEKSKGRMPSPDYERSVRYSVNLANARPRPIEKTPEAVEYLVSSFRFSPSSLDDYVQCPLRFYYRYVLGLKEREEATSEIDPMGVGKLIHQILKKFYHPLCESVLTPDRLGRARLLEVIGECFTETFGAEPAGPAYFIKRQMIFQLTLWLEKFEIPRVRESPVRLIDVEKPITIRRGEISFTGRIDRIEERHDHTAIIDYKTGNDDKRLKIRPEKYQAGDADSRAAAVGSFQLPMYVLLYSSATGLSPGQIVPAYHFLGSNRIDKSIEAGLGDDPEEAAAVYRAVEPIIFEVVAEALDPAKPFLPTSDFKGQCPRCPFVAICGTQWVGGRQNDL